jgi:NAD(P)H-dependent FMN reductase
MDEGPLYIPVILGTTRKGRMSEPVARFVVSEAERFPAVVTELIDIGSVPMPLDNAGEAIRDPRFGDRMSRADGLIVVVPEYNHSFPGLLKHVLDSCLEEYIHKPVGIVGVAAGAFGGTRVIQSFLAVMRELGLATTYTDLYFGKVYDLFDESGNLRDKKFVKRAQEFLKELVWMATTLRWGRKNVPMQEEEPKVPEPKMTCPECDAVMNHHANKLVDPQSAEDAARVDPDLGCFIEEAHCCPECGKSASRRVGAGPA